jgi:hypothetical protein
MIKVRLAGTRRAAESTKIDCKNLKSFRYHRPSLLPPALLGKSSAVSEHHGTSALAIGISANLSTVIGRKRDGFLCDRQRSEREGQSDAAKDQHAGII